MKTLPNALIKLPGTTTWVRPWEVVSLSLRSDQAMELVLRNGHTMVFTRFDAARLDTIAKAIEAARSVGGE